MTTSAERPDARAHGDTLRWLVPAAVVAWVVALYAALVFAPTARIEGDIQRMMYLHVPAALTMYVAYFVVFLGSVVYLAQRRQRWDQLAAAAAEVGTLFATIVLLTGPIWGKVAWGTWWVWDARLTSTLVLWLVFVAYLMLRRYGGSDQQVARYCAVLGIVGFADIPIIHYSVRWWRTLHPEPKIMTEGSLGAGLEPSMLLAVGLGLVAALLLFAVLLTLRLRLERLSRRVAGVRAETSARP